MLYLPAEKLKPGMVVASPVLDFSGEMIADTGCHLNSDNIKKINSFKGAFIEDDLSKKLIVKDIISNDLRKNTMLNLNNFDLKLIKKSAKDIVDSLVDNSSLSLDLKDLQSFDDCTYKHSVNVAILSTILGIKMGLKYDDITDLCLGALLHDLGKLKIPEEILNKPGKLNQLEYSVIKTHPTSSYYLVKNRLDISEESKLAILSHHENFNGSGYPLGLKNDEIHLLAKIIHVADVYDALTSKRPYKEAYDSADALKYLVDNSGFLFDKDVVKTIYNI